MGKTQFSLFIRLLLSPNRLGKTASSAIHQFGTEIESRVWNFVSLLVEKIKKLFEVYESVFGCTFSWHRFTLTDHARAGNIIPQPFSAKILCPLDLPDNQDQSPP